MIHISIRKTAGEHEPLTEYKEFRELLLRVVGQALAASGYQLEESPFHEESGLFRFRRSLTGDSWLLVDYQLLLHPAIAPRFQVILQRVTIPGADGSLASARISLARLVGETFGIRVLPAIDHWWACPDRQALVNALLESGKLLIGYGLPWLDGSLRPPQP